MNKTMEYRQFLKRRKIHALACIFIMLFAGTTTAWSVFVPYMEEGLGFSRTQISVAYSLAMGIGFIAATGGALVARKIGRPKVVFVCGLIYGAGMIFTGQAHSLAALYICYGIGVGCAFGIIYNSVLSIITTWYPEKSGFITGVMLMFFGFSGMIMSPIATFLLVHIGWRMTFLVFGIAIGFVVVALSFLVSPHRDDLPEEIRVLMENQKGSTLVSLDELKPTEMIRQANYWKYFFFSIFLATICMALQGHAGMIGQAAGVSPERVGFCVGIVALFNGLGRVTFGIAFDKLGFRFAVTTACILAIVGNGIMALALIHMSVPLIVVAFVICGYMFGCSAVITPNFVRYFFGNEYFGENFSIMGYATTITGFIAPTLAAVVFEAYSYSVVAFGFLGLSTVGLLLSFTVREKKRD